MTAIPTKKMIRRSPYRYACDVCDRSGYERVYMGAGCKEIAVCLRCLQTAAQMLERDIEATQALRRRDEVDAKTESVTE